MSTIYLSTVPLTHHITDKLEETWLRSLLKDALTDLEQLHQTGKTHGAISPECILLCEGEYISLQLTPDKNENVHPYMSIEMIQQDGKPDQTSDLYSLGAVMYHVITGEAPPQSDQRRLARQDIYRPLANQTELHERYSRDFLATIDKALSLWPEDRWRNAAEWNSSLSSASSDEVQLRLNNITNLLRSKLDKGQPKNASKSGGLKETVIKFFALIGVAFTAWQLLIFLVKESLK